MDGKATYIDAHSRGEVTRTLPVGHRLNKRGSSIEETYVVVCTDDGNRVHRKSDGVMVDEHLDDCTASGQPPLVCRPEELPKFVRRATNNARRKSLREDKEESNSATLIDLEEKRKVKERKRREAESLEAHYDAVVRDLRTESNDRRTLADLEEKRKLKKRERKEAESLEAHYDAVVRDLRAGR